jgi:hypothetical protein
MSIGDQLLTCRRILLPTSSWQSKKTTMIILTMEAARFSEILVTNPRLHGIPSTLIFINYAVKASNHASCMHSVINCYKLTVLWAQSCSELECMVVVSYVQLICHCPEYVMIC